jgi:glycyl-tRNA synthetase beta chain
MRHHQKYFSVASAPGVLAPHFVAVMNIPGDPENIVKKGNERVLRARFNDARFFWNVDQQKKLIDRVDDLANVTFQAKLGSYKAKTDRVIELVKELGGNADAQRAALLCKCDLTTEMVKEFTDLQGVVGGLYAKAQGEPEPVWRAIYEHYQPLSMEDSIPETREGQILALADKLDTLRGCFAIGMAPTGSKDPFALRRAAQGVIKILAEAKLDYLLDQLASGELHAFLVDRVQYYFREMRGYKYDEVNAVLAVGCGMISDLEARLSALAEVRPTPNFRILVENYKRINNILKQANFADPDRSTSLDDAVGPAKDLLVQARPVFRIVENRDYAASLEAIASLGPHVNSFFEHVLVNDPNPMTRRHHLSLLHYLRANFSTIADFSEIVTAGDQNQK